MPVADCQGVETTLNRCLVSPLPAGHTDDKTTHPVGELQPEQALTAVGIARVWRWLAAAALPAVAAADV